MVDVFVCAPSLLLLLLQCGISVENCKLHPPVYFQTVGRETIISSGWGKGTEQEEEEEEVNFQAAAGL
jgi:hypothetical protein